ncbi:DUF4188 domain-containing protein [Microbacterium sp. RD1]|uniref:DUF4188 domain-containing protein n=1 Tax=Microbacterium sp. RD1 TaxID=3457313 RepID=UPI003FA610D0
MARVIRGRMTHRYSGELVVFHIGMQINKWWRPDLWIPVFSAMPPMLRELSADRDSGMLSYELLLGAGGPYIVQYWSSIDKLYDYATSPTQRHRPAWTRFNRMARSAPEVVGVWHETFLVERAESMYVSTKPMGLPKATELVAVAASHTHARDRFVDGRTPASGRDDEQPGEAQPVVERGNTGARTLR